MDKTASLMALSPSFFKDYAEEHRVQHVYSKMKTGCHPPEEASGRVN
jgi:hypothetical protein